MSAYVVSDLHINTLVSWAVKNKVCVYSPHRIAIAEEPARVAGILYTANVESVNDRYSADGVSIGLVFKPVAKLPDAMTIVKLCHCLAYQSNEVSEYENTIGAAIVNAIESYAIRALPGYDAAPWGI